MKSLLQDLYTITLLTSSSGVQDHSKVLPREKETFPIDTTTHTFISWRSHNSFSRMFTKGRGLRSKPKAFQSLVYGFGCQLFKYLAKGFDYIMSLKSICRLVLALNIFGFGQSLLSATRNISTIFLST